MHAWYDPHWAIFAPSACGPRQLPQVLLCVPAWQCPCHMDPSVRIPCLTSRVMLADARDVISIYLSIYRRPQGVGGTAALEQAA